MTEDQSTDPVVPNLPFPTLAVAVLCDRRVNFGADVRLEGRRHGSSTNQSPPG